MSKRANVLYRLVVSVQFIVVIFTIAIINIELPMASRWTPLLLRALAMAFVLVQIYTIGKNTYESLQDVQIKWRLGLGMMSLTAFYGAAVSHFLDTKVIYVTFGAATIPITVAILTYCTLGWLRKDPVEQ